MNKTPTHRKVRMGMIGGGPGAFIGAVHRQAAALDGQIELVCGAFSSDPIKSKQMGTELFLNDNRVYGSWKEMLQKESELPEDAKMDFVAIVTPNHVHFEPAKAALEHGFHVMIDKPITFSLEEAIELKSIVTISGLWLGLTHTYTGYPMVKEAKSIVASGKIGSVRKIYVEYPQGWLSSNLEKEGQKQADWRTDPSKSGKAGCIGDIGTHAANLAEYVSGLRITSLAAKLNIVVPDRRLDDDGAILLELSNGATGVLMASQIAAGEENNLKVRVFGELGSIEWQHVNPNSLHVKFLDGPNQEYRTGVDNAYLSDHAIANTRLPSGHPEGYIEAFANLYRNFASTIRARIDEKNIDNTIYDFPTVEDGVRGMLFIDRSVTSSENGGKWTLLE